MRRLSVIAMLLNCLALPLTAQDGRVQFSNFGVRSGLGTSVVNDLAQDSTGYIWVATADGIRRFDGHRFTDFRADPAKTDGLPDNSVECAFVDASNRKWFGTREGGIARFEETSGRFSRYAGGLGPVHTITEDREGRLLAATAHGVIAYDEAGDKWTRPTPSLAWMVPAPFAAATDNHQLTPTESAGIRQWSEQLFPDSAYARRSLVEAIGPASAGRLWPALHAELREEHPRDGLGSAYANVSALATDPDNNLYLGYYQGGIGVWPLGDPTPRVIRPNRREGRGGKNQITSMLWLHDSLLVARTDQGVELIDVITGEGRPFLEGLTEVGIQDVVREGNTLYLASSVGVIVHDLTTGNTRRYDATGEYEYGLTTAETSCVLPAPDGVIWVGHGHHGLSMGLTTAAMFAHPRPDDPPLPHYMRGVTTVLQDGRGRLWFGHFEGGVRRADPETLNTLESYLTGYENGIARSSIFTLFEDRGGRIWGGGYRSGLIYFDEVKGDWKPYLPGDPKGLGSADVRDIAEDREGYLWVALHGYGTIRLDPRTGETRDFTPTNSGLSCSYPFDLTVDAQDRIWVATVNGLYRVGSDRREVDAVIPPANSGRYGFAHRVNTVVSLNDGTVAAGTHAGLYLFDADGEPVARSIIPERLRDPVRTIYANPQGNGLWAATEFAVHYFQPADGLLLSYQLPRGEEGVNFHARSRGRLADGRLLLGTTNGLVGFAPERLRRPMPAGRTYVSGGSFVSADGERQRLYGHPSSLELGPDNSGFTLELSGLSFGRPEASRYEVRLSPHQSGWSELPAAEPTLRVQHLSPGDYTLEYRMRNDHGLGFGPVGRLPIRVAAPWYATWYAYAGYLAFIAAAVFLYLRQFRRREALRQRMHYERREAAREREMAAEKARFFENVSHDLRTPLTLIDAPLDELRRQPELPLAERRRYYDIMHRSSERLNRLITRVLDWQQGELPEASAPNVVRTPGRHLEQLAGGFQPQARKEGIELELDIGPSTPVAYPAEVIARVTENLLGNALKFTPAGGRVTLFARQQPEYLRIAVRDTGPGVPQEQRERIFERFYRGAQGSGEIPGNGVGLAVVRELLDGLGGSIRCGEAPGGGAAFECIVPIGAATEAASPAVPSPNPEPAAAAVDEPAVTSGAHATDLPLLLVADDDSDIRAVIRQGARGRYRLVEAANGTAALAAARSRQPDLILSDVMMPAMDGLELCAALKADPTTSHLPVLLLTAHHGPQRQQAALAAGANAYLTKPFRLPLLFHRIDNTLATLDAARERWMRTPRAEPPAALATTAGDEGFIGRLREYVTATLSEGALDQNALFRHLTISRTLCYAKVKALTGLTLGEYVRRLRIEHAQALLHQSGATIGEVAHASGFKTTAHFSRTFKAVTGLTPGKWRENGPVEAPGR